MRLRSALRLFVVVLISAALVADALAQTQVRDLNPGAGDGVRPSFTRGDDGTAVLGEYVYFSGDNGDTGFELWRTDGTDAGTELVVAINPSGDSFPEWLTVHDGMLYFTAEDGTSGRELWRTDGTAAGTVRVTDLNAGADGSFPSHLASWGGALYFSANDGIVGFEPWRTDGTAAGTTLIDDLWPGATGSLPRGFYPYKGELYFAAGDDQARDGLWKTDGTAAGTQHIVSFGHQNDEVVECDGRMYFQARLTNSEGDFGAGHEVWESDGTASGTRRAVDINTGSGDSSPVDFVVDGTTLYFVADDGAAGREVWSIDCATNAATRLSDINTGSGDSAPINLTLYAGSLFFSADDGSGSELWAYDGTNASLIADIFTGFGGSRPDPMLTFGGALVFAASTVAAGREFYTLDLADFGAEIGSGGVLVGARTNLPLTIYGDVTGFGVRSATFTIDYDPATVDFCGASAVPGTLGESLAPLTSSTGAGKVTVSASPAGGSDLAGSGTLLHLCFEGVIAPDASPLTLTSFQFNQGTPTVAVLTNGTLQTYPQVLGDPTGKAGTSPWDAAYVLRHVAGETGEGGEVRLPLQDGVRLAADVDGDGTLTNEDGFVILQRYTGEIGCFPTHPDFPCLGDGGSEAAPASATRRSHTPSGTLTFGTPRQEHAPDAWRIPVLLADAVEVYSIGFEATFDTEQFTLRDLPNDLPQDWLITSHPTDTGARIALAGSTPLDGGIPFNIRLDRATPETTLELSASAIIAEEAPQLLGPLVVDPTAVDGTEVLTEGFVLTLPAPHPVTGTARMALAVGTAQRVEVTVYDVLGRRVARLHAGHVAAGSPVDIAWDATDLPAGLYVVRARGEHGRLATRAVMRVR